MYPPQDINAPLLHTVPQDNVPPLHTEAPQSHTGNKLYSITLQVHHTSGLRRNTTRQLQHIAAFKLTPDPAHQYWLILQPEVNLAE